MEIDWEVPADWKGPADWEDPAGSIKVISAFSKKIRASVGVNKQAMMTWEWIVVHGQS